VGEIEDGAGKDDQGGRGEARGRHVECGRLQSSGKILTLQQVGDSHRSRQATRYKSMRQPLNTERSVIQLQASQSPAVPISSHPVSTYTRMQRTIHPCIAQRSVPGKWAQRPNLSTADVTMSIAKWQTWGTSHARCLLGPSRPWLIVHLLV
jgi:hypothetical protein